MDPIWEKIHSSREWGKYPADDLIRTVMRTYKKSNTAELDVLEVGFGGGANLAFFVNEGFNVYGIDGAPSAVKNTLERLQGLVKPDQVFDLVSQNFADLPWPDHSFNIVVDHWAIYANSTSDIKAAFAECHRVLKPGGHLYSRSWAQGCTGFDTGTVMEPGTSNNPTKGPCKDMGTSHFFNQGEINEILAGYADRQIRLSTISDQSTGEQVIEWLCWARK